MSVILRFGFCCCQKITNTYVTLEIWRCCCVSKFFPRYYYPTGYLLVQGQQRKPHNNVWNISKRDNKELHNAVNNVVLMWAENEEVIFGAWGACNIFSTAWAIVNFETFPKIYLGKFLSKVLIMWPARYPLKITGTNFQKLKSYFLSFTGTKLIKILSNLFRLYLGLWLML